MDTSDPGGTWYLAEKTRISNSSAGNTNRITLTFTPAEIAGTFSGTCDSDTSARIDNVRWDSEERLLVFRKHPATGRANVGVWFRGTIVEGVFVGRFTDENKSTSPTDPPADLTLFVNHATGWNTDYLDQGGITPRVFDIKFGQTSAILRIDSTAPVLKRSTLVGTIKGYDEESLELDLQNIAWDGTTLGFTYAVGSNVAAFSGVASGNRVSGTYTVTDSKGKTSKPSKWSGVRCLVLTYGQTVKSDAVRQAWQSKTRARLRHLMMQSDPVSPSSFLALGEPIPPFADKGIPCQRDDDWKNSPQEYLLSELKILNLIPNPYGGLPAIRQAHGWLALPNPPPAEGTKCPAVLALNGHKGSAHRVMDPNGGHGAAPYWYGDSFARHRLRPTSDSLPYIVLALDISHRNDAPYNDDYGNGDDASHGNGPHPSVRFDGFKTSDWEETGERAWDVMRALDLLLARPDVDPNRILITGLSMGGEISMVTAALDERIGMAVVSGAPSDYHVQLEHAEDSPHRCWQWINGDLREYVDASDFLALIAPRPLILETGRDDSTYSGFKPKFAGDKQSARRARAAYGSDRSQFVHYLHTRGHQYNAGGTDLCRDSRSQVGVQIPVITEPAALGDATWQTDPQTSTTPQIPNVASSTPTIFDYIDALVR